MRYRWVSTCLWNGVARSALLDKEWPLGYRAVVERVREDLGWEVVVPAPPEAATYRTEGAARHAALRALGIDPLEVAG